MEIFALAAQLGQELKKDDRLVRMAKAKEAYEKAQAATNTASSAANRAMAMPP